jgi:hypothetical protein
VLPSVAQQGYGFNTFGEVVACWIQDIILIALVFKDRRTQPWVVVLAAAAFTAGCGFLLSPACPQQLLSTMQASNIAIMALGSRLPQILLNMRRGNAGMLSVTTCLLNVAGNAARIFTTIVLTGDLLMLGGACSQGGCVGVRVCVLCCGTRRAFGREWAKQSGGRIQACVGEGACSGEQVIFFPGSRLKWQVKRRRGHFNKTGNTTSDVWLLLRPAPACVHAVDPGAVCCVLACCRLPQHYPAVAEHQHGARAAQHGRRCSVRQQWQQRNAAAAAAAEAAAAAD